MTMNYELQYKEGSQQRQITAIRCKYPGIHSGQRLYGYSLRDEDTDQGDNSWMK
jgi:hypothetical protein